MASNIFISGIHAARYLLSDRCAEAIYEDYASRPKNFMAYREGLAELCALEPISNSAPKLSRDEATSLADWLGVDLPITVCVDSAELRRNSKKLSCQILHYGIPRGGFIQISGEVYVSPPELVIVQLADSLGLIELAVLCSLLFSLFASPSIPGGELCPRQALSNKERCLKFLLRCQPDEGRAVQGLSLAKRALDLAVEGAASPKEIETALLFSLPQEMGGYGFEQPVMNYEIPISRSPYKRYADLFWAKEEVAVEYDSDSEHASREALWEDAVRRNDLVDAGILSFSVTSKQLSELTGFARTARQVAAALGSTIIIPRDRLFNERQRQLKATIEAAMSMFGF